MIGKKLAVAAAIVGVIAGAAASLELYRQSQASREFPAPGLLLDVGGRQLQLDCRGSGTPTVLLEAGGQEIWGSLGWSHIHDDLARMTRVCAYSRAGYMWSESRTKALEAEDGARDLRTALSVAGESPPFLPVGYSRGSLNALIFTDLFRAEVAAVLFLDPRHPEFQARRTQAGLSPGSQPQSGLTQFARTLRWTGLPRAFNNYCEKTWYSAEVIDACKAYWPHSLDGIISEDSAIESVHLRAAQVKDLGALPVVVVTRQYEEAWLAANETLRNEEDLWQRLNAEIAAWSTRGTQRFVAGSTHVFPYTHPQAVLDALNDTLELARNQ